MSVITQLYSIWRGMRDRCTDKNNKWYGGKGISVHESWKDFDSFQKYVLATIGPRPDGSTLDRIDLNKNYEPDNIRWSTYKEQARNRSSNVTATIDGTTMPDAAWAEKAGMSSQALYQRKKRGMTTEQAVSTPLQTARTLEIDGVTKTIAEWAALSEIDTSLIYKRLKLGKSGKDLIVPSQKGKTLTVGDKTMSIPDWSRETGIEIGNIYQRLKRGMSPETALGLPPDLRKLNTYTINGETRTIPEWADLYGVNRSTINKQMRKGKSLQEVLRWYGRANSKQT